MKTLFLLALVFCSGILCKEAIVISDSFQQYQCLVQNGYDLAIVRAYNSNGQVDVHVNTNLKRAIQAGMKTNVYISPCINNPKIPTEQQVQDMIKNLDDPTNFLDDLKNIGSTHYGGGISHTPSSKEYNYGTIWVSVEKTNTSRDCSWESITSLEQRCTYLERIVSEILNLRINVGIYTSDDKWEDIFGDADYCQNFKNLPLLFSGYNNGYNTSDDFKYQFGGWKADKNTYYAGYVDICDADVDTGYYN